MSRLNTVLIVCSLLAPCAASAQTSAQTAAQSSPANWPTRPVTLIIPYAPGSNTEFEPRLYASKLTEISGKQFLLDFKPGGGTLLAAQYAAKAPGDGHTLMVITATFPLLPLMFRDAGFDPIKSFTAVSQMSKRSTLFVISNSLPASNVREYIAYARANPGKVNFATTGTGGTQHLHAVWMHSLMGIETTYIPYKGVGVILPDMVAGRVDVGIVSIAAAMGMVKTGKLRVLGYGGKERVTAMPDVPTIAEQGVPEFEYLSWLGVVAPAATPASLVSRISADLAKAARSPDVVERLAKEANTVVASTPQEFQRQINSEVERWRALVHKTGFKFEDG